MLGTLVLLVLLAAGLSMVDRGGYRATALTVVGGALLGLGAWTNGACAFGSVARLGSGNWAYLATPLGFGLGAALLPVLIPIAPPPRLADHSQLLDFSLAWAVALTGVAIWLAVSLWRARHSRTWTPAVATLVIGLCFVFILLLTGGAWTWTDTVSEIAKGMGVEGVWPRAILIIALFAVAIAGSVLMEGLPLFWPFAWLAWGSMCVTIAIAIRMTQARG